MGHYAGTHKASGHYASSHYGITFLIFKPKDDEGGGGRVVAVKGKPTNADILAIQREDEELIAIVAAIGEFLL